MRPHFPRVGPRAMLAVAMMAWLFLLASFAHDQLQAQSISAYRIEWVRPNILEISCTGDGLKLVYVWEGLEYQKGNCDGVVYEVAGSRHIELNELVDSRIDIRGFDDTTHYTYFAPPFDQVIMPMIVQGG